MIKSALQSSLTNDIKYRSMSAGAVPSSEYLIASTVVPSNTPSVTLDLSGLGSIYKHITIVSVVKSTSTLDSGTRWDRLVGQFNSDTTGSNYRNHALQSQTPNVISYTDANVMKAVGFAGRSNEQYAASTIELLDAFNPNKYTTVRTLTGFNGSSSASIALMSGLWMNTAAVTSLTIFSEDGAASIAQNSRFSVYGVTA